MKDNLMDLVIYDQQEYFRQFDDADFDWPFAGRKNVLTRGRRYAIDSGN